MVEEGPGEVHDSGASSPLQSPPRSRAPEADPGTPGPAAIVTSRAAGRGPRECPHPTPPRPGPLAVGVRCLPPRAAAATVTWRAWRGDAPGEAVTQGAGPGWARWARPNPGLRPGIPRFAPPASVAAKWPPPSHLGWGRSPCVTWGRAGGSLFPPPTASWSVEIPLLPRGQLRLDHLSPSFLPPIPGLLEEAPREKAFSDGKGTLGDAFWGWVCQWGPH